MVEMSEDQQVKFVRLKNGDDVIAQVVEFSENEESIMYALISPLKVLYLASDRGAAYMQVAFMPWVFTRICDDQEFMIHAEDILTISSVTDKMIDYYWNNLDHFMGKNVIEESEPEVEEGLDLESLLEAIKSKRRTMH